ncbi:hypothetical protein LEN26_007833 [Aphanomyces euteiches]|nr:hypothetical protein LEN26_007833 [Aphanomyces euteiches]
MHHLLRQTHPLDELLSDDDDENDEVPATPLSLAKPPPPYIAERAKKAAAAGAAAPTTKEVFFADIRPFDADDRLDSFVADSALHGGNDAHGHPGEIFGCGHGNNALDRRKSPAVRQKPRQILWDAPTPLLSKADEETPVQAFN